MDQRIAASASAGGRIAAGALLLALGLAGIAVALLLVPGPRAGDLQTPVLAAHDFELRDVNPQSRTHGKTVRLSSLYPERGLVLNFMASWCGPCREELPMLQGVHKSRGVPVICMAADEYGGPEGLLPVIEASGITMPVLFAPDGTAQKLAEHYTYQILPATYLIDRRGKIRSVHQGMMQKQDLVAAIERELD